LPSQYRTDGANYELAFFVGLRDQQMEDASAKVEAIKDDISCDHDSDENEPHRFQVTSP